MLTHLARSRRAARVHVLSPSMPPELIVVAASTGGPTVLRELITALPSDLGVPVLVVQHLPTTFVESFVSQLSRLSETTIRLAEPGALVSPGVWFAPGGAHTGVRRHRDNQLRFVVNEGVPILGCQPAADVLFGSAASACEGRCLGLVLSGMGRDGCEGARRIVEAGGRVIVQDKASSAVWGMPGSVARAGLASRVLSPEAIKTELVRLASS